MDRVPHQIGEQFLLHFVWQLPDGDYLRTIFLSQVRAIDTQANKYTVQLRQLKAGRQEEPGGSPRPKTALSLDYWALVRRLIGNEVTVAFEAADGRPLRLRLATLTGEHDFFFRGQTAQSEEDSRE